MKNILIILLLVSSACFGQQRFPIAGGSGGGSGTPATSAELNTGTDNAKFASALALEGSKYLTQAGGKISATASGTNIYTATIAPAITSYTAGQRFYITFTNSNTGASTINLNSLGAKTINKNSSTALASGDIIAGQVVLLAYDGTNFQIIGSIGTGGGSGTVNSGTQYRLAHYATTGTAVSEAAVITAARALVSDANGVPTHSTTTTTQLQYLNAATGTTGTTSTNLVFSTAPTFTTNISVNSAAHAYIAMNSATGSNTYVSGSVNSSVYTYFGTAGATNSFITGSALGDMVLRVDAKNLLIGTNTATGTSIYVKTGNAGVGIKNVSPTAWLHIGAGTTAASTAPLKFTSGSLQTTAEAGAVEFLTDKYYGTITTSAARKEFTLNDAALTLGRVPYVTTNGRLTDNANFTYDGTNLRNVGRITSNTYSHAGLTVHADPDTLAAFDDGQMYLYVMPTTTPVGIVNEINTITYTIASASGAYIYNNSTSIGAWTLPALNNYRYEIKNISDDNLVITRAGSDNLYDTGSVTSITLTPGQSRTIWGGGSFWYVF